MPEFTANSLLRLMISAILPLKFTDIPRIDATLVGNCAEIIVDGERFIVVAEKRQKENSNE